MGDIIRGDYVAHRASHITPTMEKDWLDVPMANANLDEKRR